MVKTSADPGGRHRRSGRVAFFGRAVALTVISAGAHLLSRKSVRPSRLNGRASSGKSGSFMTRATMNVPWWWRRRLWKWPRGTLVSTIQPQRQAEKLEGRAASIRAIKR